MDEEEVSKLGWDHQTFLLDGKPFYPDLSASGDTILIKLDCRPHADLNWAIPSTAKKILWEFDFGLNEPFFPLTDELRFQSLSLACKHFSSVIWPAYKDQSIGGILYRGSADFSSHFLWNDLQKASQTSWQELHPNGNQSHFCADAFSSYFQLLAHHLPDELPLILCLDARSISSLSKALHLLSRERFEHFLLAIQREKWPQPGYYWDETTFFFKNQPAAIGLCFLKNSSMTEERFFEFDKILDELYESNQPFRVIFEEFLTEQWDQLDEIHIIRDSLSSQGLRKLKGFEAAGGKVKEIRGRGI